MTAQELLTESREAQAWNSMDDEPFLSVELLLKHLAEIGFEATLIDSFGSNQWHEWRFLYLEYSLCMYICRHHLNVEFRNKHFEGTVSEFVKNTEWSALLGRKNES